MSIKIQFLSQASHISSAPVRAYIEHSHFFRKFYWSALLEILTILASFHTPLKGIICPLNLLFSANERHIFIISDFFTSKRALDFLFLFFFLNGQFPIDPMCSCLQEEQKECLCRVHLSVLLLQQNAQAARHFAWFLLLILTL